MYEEPPQEQRSKLVQSRLAVSRVASNQSELGLLHPSDDGWNFAALCRGEELRPVLPHLLTCHLDTGPDSPAWLRLGPPRAETLHRDPDITMYHNIITHHEMKQLKQVATPMVIILLDKNIFFNEKYFSSPDLR